MKDGRAKKNLVSNSLDPDQIRHFVGPVFTFRLSAVDKSPLALVKVAKIHSFDLGHFDCILSGLIRDHLGLNCLHSLSADNNSRYKVK